jgi:probable F420-dependent oxidoreductase
MTEPRKRPLKVGVLLPHFERMMAGQTPRWADILRMAQQAEQIGFDSIWLADHLLFEPLAGEDQPLGTWECWSLLAALAASTTRIKLGTLVICTAFRNPALIAKMADTLDEISGSRLILGLGAGWHQREFDAFGFPFDHRVDRFEEALQIILPLLREGQVDFSGRYYAAKNCELRLRGPRPHGPPIVIGSVGPRMMRLAARYTDGWNTWLHNTNNSAEGIAPLRILLDMACAEVGRDPTTLERTAAIAVEFPDAVAYPEDYPGWVIGTGRPLAGSPETMAAELQAYAAAGISHIQLWINPTTSAGLAAFAPVLEILDRG